MGHPERVMPFCVRRYRVRDEVGRVVAACDDNHQSLNSIALDAPLVTSRLIIEVLEMNGDVPANLFEVRCYEGDD